MIALWTPGVLENDSYDGEPAEDGGATVKLLVSVLFGTLECASNTGLELCPDGSFNYIPGLGFTGALTPDGKVGQARYVFADDFTFGTTSTVIFTDGFE